MTGLTQAFDWEGTSSDPNDEQFGDVVEAAGLDDAGSYAGVLVGEPYDGAVIGRPGAADGPAAIRQELAAAKTHSFDQGPVASVADLGDIRMPDGAGVAEVQDDVADAADSVHALDGLPVFLGGDNSLTYANVAPLLDGDDSVAVVSLDAHLDCREVRDGPTSGTPYRQLFEAGLDTLAVVGARDFETSTAYADFLESRDGTVVTAGAVGADLEAAADRALDAISGADRVYLSLDCDVLDATAAPGVSAPTPGGLSTQQLYRLLGRLADSPRLAGFEVVECAPPLDSSNRTAKAASRAVANVLASTTHD
ncbi:formimidoylglutamase [Halobacteriales archaeon Cl-PHB]